VGGQVDSDKPEMAGRFRFPVPLNAKLMFISGLMVLYQ